MCKGGEFDLSFESLTSHAAQQALRDLPMTDPKFFAEITQPRSHINVPPSLNPEQEALEDALPDEGPTDDSDVPFLEVHAHHHETLHPMIPTPLPDASQVYVPIKAGGLSSTACAEETLVESVDGEVVDVTPQEDSRGCSRRNRVKNV
jgi:hypothetical protein